MYLTPEKGLVFDKPLDYEFLDAMAALLRSGSSSDKEQLDSAGKDLSSRTGDYTYTQPLEYADFIATLDEQAREFLGDGYFFISKSDHVRMWHAQRERIAYHLEPKWAAAVLINAMKLARQFQADGYDTSAPENPEPEPDWSMSNQIINEEDITYYRGEFELAVWASQIQHTLSKEFNLDL